MTTNLSSRSLLTILLCGATTLSAPKYFVRADAILFAQAPAQAPAQATKADEDPGDTAAGTKPKPAQTPAPAVAARPTLEIAWRLVRTYEFGQSRAPLDVIWDALRAGQTAAQRAALAKNLIPLLEPATSVECKRFACRMIKSYGPPEAVPALAPLLRDVQLNTYARYALESMETPAALNALRQVVKDAAKTPNALPQSTLIGCIASLGARRDTASVRDLASFASNADAAIASAAIVALGQIGDIAAAEELLKASLSKNTLLQNAAVDALLQIAENARRNRRTQVATNIFQMIYDRKPAVRQRAAALRGALIAEPENALGLLKSTLRNTDPIVSGAARRTLPVFLLQPGATQSIQPTLISWLRGEDATLQLAMLNALNQIEPADNDNAWREAVAAALNSTDATVRLEALKTLGVWGNAATVPALLKIAASATGAEKSAAQSALERLRGEDVETALFTLADNAGAPALERAVALRTLGARRSNAAVVVLLRVARDKDESVRVAALLALGESSRPPDWPELLQLFDGVGDKERGALERSLLAVANRAHVTTRSVFSGSAIAALNEQVNRKNHANAATLLRVLNALGSDDALAAVRAVLKANADGGLNEAAVRALSDWKNGAALDDLLQLAKTAEKPAWQLLALRGAIRLIGASNDKADIKIARLQNAMALAQRPDEKKLVLAEAGKIKAPIALQFVAPFLDQADVQAETEAAVIAMLGKGYAASPNKKIERDTLAKVLQSKDERTRKSATDLLKKFGA